MNNEDAVSLVVEQVKAYCRVYIETSKIPKWMWYMADNKVSPPFQTRYWIYRMQTNTLMVDGYHVNSLLRRMAVQSGIWAYCQYLEARMTKPQTSFIIDADTDGIDRYLCADWRDRR